jgi:hypothetical protein
VELVMPPALELITVRVEGLPVTANPMGNNHWRIPLGPDQLPQRLEVIYSGTLPSETLPLGRLFPTPTLEGLPVAATIWTVHGPPAMNAGAPALSHIESSAANQASQRLTSAESMLDSASAAISQSASAETDAWRARWEQHVAVAEQNVRIAEQSAAAPHKVTARNEASAHDPVEVWQLQQTSQGPATRCVMRGTAPRVVVSYAQSSQESILRTILAVSILGGSVLMCLVLRMPTVTEWLARWPYLVGVLLGITWWLFLTPSMLGLFIVLACVIGSLRPR